MINTRTLCVVGCNREHRNGKIKQLGPTEQLERLSWKAAAETPQRLVAAKKSQRKGEEKEKKRNKPETK